jgi:hypothetical protein
METNRIDTYNYGSGGIRTEHPRVLAAEDSPWLGSRSHSDRHRRLLGRTVAQEVSSRPPMAEVRVRARVK